MATYTIYANPAGSLEAVKPGFSWPGFFFTIIWALVKKLWRFSFWLFLVILITSVLDVLAEMYFNIEGIIVIKLFRSLLLLLMSIYVGLFGNDWVTENLRAKGYEFVNNIQASSLIEAVQQASRERHKKTSN